MTSLGYKHTEDAKRRIGLNGFHYGMLGKHLSKISKEKISKNNARYWKGKFKSFEQRLKIQKTLTGRHLSEEHKNNIKKSAITNLNFGMRGKKMSKESLKILSKIRTGKTSGMKGKHHSIETKLKLRNINLGKQCSEGTKLKLSEKLKGRVKTAQECLNIKLSKLGHMVSIKTKQKISLNKKGKHQSKESIQKMKNKWNTTQMKKFAKERRANQILPKQDTKPEIKMQNLLKELNIEFIPHKYISEIEHAYQCDIFIPSKNLIIECDGNYWHNYPLGNEIDIIRNKELHQAGYHIFRFWENEIKVMETKDLNLVLEKLK